MRARFERLARRLVERHPVVAVVRLQGVIIAGGMSRRSLDAGSVGPALERAFGLDRLVAVALQVNSPGGSAVQSALIAERVREHAAKAGVPVITFCEDIAASGGYWLACAGDEIYADESSLVGSVGVISAGFGLQGLIERLGVERRVHTAGEHKSKLDPFAPEDSEDVAWLRGVQDEIHEAFKRMVIERRGDRLRAPHDELFNGDVWTGRRAVELGVIDGVASLRPHMRERFGADVVFTPVGQRRSPLARLGLESLLDAAQARAVWARYGL
jgi:signal peptide peptidase SppA